MTTKDSRRGADPEANRQLGEVPSLIRPLTLKTAARLGSRTLVLERVPREHLLLRDDALRPAVAEERDRPVEEDETRFLKPVSAARWTRSQRSRRRSRRRADGRAPRSRGSGDRRHRSAVAVAERPARGVARDPPEIVSAAWRPDWIATCATPGRPSRLIRSPITKTSGCPGACSRARPSPDPRDRPRRPPLRRARRPSGEASTPAAQNFVAASIRRSSGSAELVSIPRSSTPVTLAPTWISTPISRRSRARRSQRLRERSGGSRPGVEQDDPRCGRIDVAEVPAQRPRATARRAGPPPRRPSARRRPRRTSASGVARQGRSRLGHLERAEDAAA